MDIEGTKLLMLFCCRKRAQNKRRGAEGLLLCYCDALLSARWLSVLYSLLRQYLYLPPASTTLPLAASMALQPSELWILKKKLLGKNQCESRHKIAADTQKTSNAWAETWNRKITQLESVLTERRCTQLHYVRLAWFGLMLFPSVYTWLRHTGLSSCVFSQNEVRMKLINMLMMKQMKNFGLRCWHRFFLYSHQSFWFEVWH